MKKYDRIEINPDITFGKPVIKNTRITIEQILRKLAAGMTLGEIIADHPHLRREDIMPLKNSPLIIWPMSRLLLLKRDLNEISGR